MHRTRLLLSLLALISMLFALAPAGLAQPPQPDEVILLQGEAPWVVRAYYDDPDMILQVVSWTEPWEVHRDKGYLVLEVDAAQVEWLVEAGYRLEVDEALTAQLHQVNEYLPGQVDGIPGYPCYRTVEETFATAVQIVTDYPDLATWTDIGDSWEKTQPGGLPGYDIMVLRLTNANVPGPKPDFLANCAIHAREYTTAELCTRYAEYLVENYGVDPDVTWLLDYHEVHLLLHTNPDGRKLAEGGASWRKNTDNDDGCNNPSSWGVDMNRNFDFLWGCCGGSSGDPCASTYRGPSAASEPEIQALQAYARSIFPDQREDPISAAAPITSTGIWLDIHSYSQLVLWSWGFTPDPSPNSTGLQTLGRKMAYFNGYWPEQANSGLYPTDGSTKDFAYGDLGVPGYTIELGTSFFQDCPTFENIILPDNLQMLFYASKAVRFSYMLPSGPDALDPLVSPGAVVPGDPVQLTATINDTRYNNSNGSEPTQNIAAAEYYVDVPPWVTTPTPVAYPMTPVDGSFNSTIEDVEATIDTSALSSDRHILFVRGQDASGNWGIVSAAFLYVVDPAVAPVIEGYVRDAGTNTPLDATVTAGAFQALTNPATGYYSMTVVSGTYDMSASADGYATSQVSGVEAHDYQTVPQNFSLYPICQIFADDVESGNQGWTAQGNWAITTEASHSPSHSWTDSPGGNYGNYWDYALTSPVFDLSTYEGVTLDFWHIYDLEDGYDYGYLEVSTNGGGSWSPIASYNGENQTTWMEEELDLSQLDGQANARIRYRIDTDSYVTEDGWHIDDVVLLGGGPACIIPLAPSAGFSSNSPVTLGEPMVFTNLTTGTLPIDYLWAFGDGDSSTEEHPSHTYALTGTFTVTLVTTNSVGSDSVSHPVEVLPYVCMPVQILDTITDVSGCVVTFSVNLEGTAPFAYDWDFGALGGSSVPNPVVDFGASGTYPYALTVTNACGQDVYAGAVTVACVVCDPVDILSVTADISGCQVLFGAGLSGDPPIDLLWHFGDGLTSTEEMPLHDYGVSGSYTVTLEAWNCVGSGYDVYTRVVAVDCTPPCEPVQIITVTEDISGCVVSFGADLSGDLPFDYDWDFGALGGSTEPSPTIDFGSSGSYPYALTVSNCTGTYTDSYVGEVVVDCTPPCEPVQIISVTENISGCVVSFGADLSGDPPFTYDWDFGATGGSTEPSPTIDFGDSGTYPYTLTVSNCAGAYTDSNAGEVTVNCCDPVHGAELSWLPTTPATGEVVTFTGSAEGTVPIAYAWAFGDGTLGAGDTVTHTYAITGDYVVVLTATNDCGQEVVTDSLTVVAEPTCTEVTIVDVTYDVVDCAFTFTPELYGDPPFSYLWHFSDGLTSTEQMPTHDFGVSGSYTVTLEVWNCESEGYDEHSLVVECDLCEPPANLSSAWSPLQPGVGVEVAFTGSATGTEPLAFDWAFGDGEFGLGATVTHTYAITGDYIVMLTVSNACGEMAITDTIAVLSETVCVPADIVTVSLSAAGCEVSLYPEVNGDRPIAYLWTFGDGLTSTEQMPTHDFLNSGTYTVTLGVENCEGTGSDSYAFPVTVDCTVWYHLYLPLVVK